MKIHTKQPYDLDVGETRLTLAMGDVILLANRREGESTEPWGIVVKWPVTEAELVAAREAILQYSALQALGQ